MVNQEANTTKDALAFAQKKDIRNLSAVPIDLLLDLVDEKFSESTKMVEIRERFANETDEEKLRSLTGEYIDLAEVIADDTRLVEGRVALFVFYVIFYSSRQTPLVEECFQSAVKDAINLVVELNLISEEVLPTSLYNLLGW